jgi:succinate dehydrogenase/fumarate reductase-like Fe-S protein
MSENRIINVFRYDPTTADKGHYDRFEMEIDDVSKTTVLDVLFRIQKSQDDTIGFRFVSEITETAENN